MLQSGFRRLIPPFTICNSAKSQRWLTGLVLTGKYESPESNVIQLSECAKQFNERVSSKLVELAGVSRISKTRTFYGLHEDYPIVTLSIVAPVESNDKLQEYDISSRHCVAEAVRSAVGNGISALRADDSVDRIEVDSSGNAKAASEAAQLALYTFDVLKSKKKTPPELIQCQLIDLPATCVAEWEAGVTNAVCQNLARNLMESPANHMTPRLFVEAMQKKVSEQYSDKITVVVRDKEWIMEQRMGSFLSVSQGSDEPPFLLELHYNNAESAPICLVGKGVTFDTGGISIKPSKGMDAMRADMGGAACVASATLGAAALNLPINLITLIPLCENMPSGCATKPGDVVTAMNGKTIQVDNTDAEGRLILADALTYADTFEPSHVVDMATLTGAMAVALGGECVGTYSTCESLWSALEKGGYISGDRLWRMPLFKEYGDLLKSRTADINNISSGPYGGSITAAKFLQNFVKCKSWAHLDIAGVMDSTASFSYLPKGMSGRPTRSIIEALKLLSINK